MKKHDAAGVVSDPSETFPQLRYTRDHHPPSAASEPACSLGDDTPKRAACLRA